MVRYRLQLVREEDLAYDVKVPKVGCPEAVVQLLEDIGMGQEPEEVMVMLALNTKNMVVGIFEVSRGLINSSLVHPREVFKRALLANATSIIMAHNHPSGDPEPSREDVNITEVLVKAGDLLKVPVLDHIIIGEGTGANRYVSLKARRLM